MNIGVDAAALGMANTAVASTNDVIQATGISRFNAARGQSSRFDALLVCIAHMII
jgi:hypothetical protein